MGVPLGISIHLYTKILSLSKSEISCISAPAGPMDYSTPFSSKEVGLSAETQPMGSGVQVILLARDRGAHTVDVFNWFLGTPQLDNHKLSDSKNTLHPDVKICTPVSSRRSSNSEDNLILPLHNLSDWIETIIQRKKAQQLPNVRLINISLGFSRKSIYTDTEEDIHLEKSKKNFWELKKETPNRIDIITQVENLLNSGQEIKQALARYQQVTCDAAKAGITLVVAAGNDEDKWLMATHPEASLNMFTMSDCVISVAASDEQGAILPFSSRGTERWHPTISAPGPFGTSQAAPPTVQVLKKALEKNPTLDFWQQKGLLEQTATDTPAPKIAEGAGVINPVEFLKAVDEMTKPETEKPK